MIKHRGHDASLTKMIDLEIVLPYGAEGPFFPTSASGPKFGFGPEPPLTVNWLHAIFET